MKRTLFLLFILFLNITTSQSWVSEKMVNSVILIGQYENGKFQPTGQGVAIQDDNKSGITNIVTSAKFLKGSEIFVQIQCNPKLKNYFEENNIDTVTSRESKWKLQAENLILRVPLVKNSTYIVDSENNIGVFSVDYGRLITDSKLLMSNSRSLSNSDGELINDINPGTEVYFVGYPNSMGIELNSILTSENKKEDYTPYIRTGYVSWLSLENNIFILDSFSFGGNEGCPVFSKNLLDQRGSNLLGIIVGYVPSQKSENMGMVKCVSFNMIKGLLNEFGRLK